MNHPVTTDNGKKKPDAAEGVRHMKPSVTVETGAHGGEQIIALAGVWTTHSVHIVDKTMASLTSKLPGSESVVVDCSGMTQMDTAGAWMIIRLEQVIDKSGGRLVLKAMDPSHESLLNAVRSATKRVNDDDGRSKKPGWIIGSLEAIGRGVEDIGNDVKMGLHILGASITGAQMKAGHSNRLSATPIVAQIDQTGVKAIPIVVLMTSIVGAIIAQQGAFQLRYFGAEIFVVDLVSILVLREIGVLITAIIVAGRSGSAITAEIGSMKMREEIDALTVIGLNPVGVLVFPRIVALIVALLLLTFIADMAAMAGAMFVAKTYSGISIDSFITRAREAIDMTTFLAGIIKAPFMAMIIGIIASVEGLKVGGSAESLGKRVTASVVKSIFVVIVVDGLFAIFYAAIDF